MWKKEEDPRVAKKMDRGKIAGVTQWKLLREGRA